MVSEVKALRAAAGLAAEPYDVIIEGDSWPTVSLSSR
jgi:hypothetical protein